MLIEFEGKGIKGMNYELGSVVLVLDRFNKFIKEDRPAVVLLDLLDVSDSGSKFEHHFPEVLVDLFGFFYAVLTVIHELLVKRHHFLQVKPPNLHCRLVLHCSHCSLFTNQIKLVSVHVHVLKMTAVFGDFFLKIVYVFCEVFGRLATGLYKNLPEVLEKIVKMFLGDMARSDNFHYVD
jgi:hypothetical protein